MECPFFYLKPNGCLLLLEAFWWVAWTTSCPLAPPEPPLFMVCLMQVTPSLDPLRLLPHAVKPLMGNSLSVIHPARGETDGHFPHHRDHCFSSLLAFPLQSFQLIDLERDGQTGVAILRTSLDRDSKSLKNVPNL